MLQGDWTVGAVLYVVLKAMLAIVMWGAASIGYLGAPLSLAMRLLAGAGAVLLVVAQPITDEAGFAVVALVLWLVVWRSRGRSRRRSITARAATRTPLASLVRRCFFR